MALAEFEAVEVVVLTTAYDWLAVKRFEFLGLVEVSLKLEQFSDDLPISPISFDENLQHCRKNQLHRTRGICFRIIYLIILM